MTASVVDLSTSTFVPFHTQLAALQPPPAATSGAFGVDPRGGLFVPTIAVDLGTYTPSAIDGAAIVSCVDVGYDVLPPQVDMIEPLGIYQSAIYITSTITVSGTETPEPVTVTLAPAVYTPTPIIYSPPPVVYTPEVTGLSTKAQPAQPAQPTQPAQPEQPEQPAQPAGPAQPGTEIPSLEVYTPAITVYTPSIQIYTIPAQLYTISSSVYSIGPQILTYTPPPVTFTPSPETYSAIPDGGQFTPSPETFQLPAQTYTPPLQTRPAVTVVYTPGGGYSAPVAASGGTASLGAVPTSKKSSSSALSVPSFVLFLISWILIIFGTWITFAIRF
jgi:hypothetical protein